MHARLEFQLRVGALADDARDDLAIAAVLAGIRAQDLDGPTPALRIAAVHPKQVPGEDRGLVPARAGTHLEKQIRIVVRILRHEMHQEPPLEIGAPRDELLVLVVGERAQLRIAGFAQLLGRRDLALELAICREVARDLVEPRIFLR